MNKPKAFICGGGVMHGKPANLPTAIQSQDQERTNLPTWSRTMTGGSVRMVVRAAPPVIALLRRMTSCYSEQMASGTASTSPPTMLSLRGTTASGSQQMATGVLI